MVSRTHKRTAMYRSLQLLRSITNSHASRKSLATLEVSNYIKGLKQRLEYLNQAVVEAQNFIHYDEVPVVKLHSDVAILHECIASIFGLRVEEQEKGFLIKVLSQKSCEGLLVFILEAFEELGLEVLHARVSCVNSFCLEAVGTKDDNEGTGNLKAREIEVLLRAIENWRKVTKL